jgi:hypothetical protein
MSYLAEALAWPHGQLVLDVEPGFVAGFSLDAGEGMYFTTREDAVSREQDSSTRPCQKPTTESESAGSTGQPETFA